MRDGAILTAWVTEVDSDTVTPTAGTVDGVATGTIHMATPIGTTGGTTLMAIPIGTTDGTPITVALLGSEATTASQTSPAAQERRL